MIRVCPLSALPRGEALRVEAEPPITVFHTEDGEVFAFDDTCTHQDASLADGWVDEPVAVLSMNQTRLFGRWRRQLNAASVPA
jgi:nitrite reductase/ring-hydroxylating ferredoxin subunit